MSQYKNKTTQTNASVAKFIASIKDPQQKADAKVLLKLLQQASRQKPVMWGPSIVGFGKYHYKYASGHEGDSALTGFSPRKQAMTIYVVPGFQNYAVLMNKLGKYKTSVSCLYVKKLSDIHLPTLKELIATSVRDVRTKYSAKV
jgi:hypothetical protein